MSKFKAKIDGLVAKMQQQEDGTWVLPKEVEEELDEPTLFAVTAERRYRDTQSAYTKAQQEAKKLSAVNKGLTDHMVKSATLHITPEQKTELEKLKRDDPEKWRIKLDKYEEESQNILKNKLTEIETESSNKSELEIRQEKFKAFTENTGIELNDEIVDNELPPKYKRQLEKGEIDFDTFLEQASTFLKADKVIEGTTDEDEDEEKDLSSVAGGQEPDVTAQEKDLDATYEKTVF